MQPRDAQEPRAAIEREPRHRRSRKGRGKWCRGKLGVEHEWGEWYVAFAHYGCPVCRPIERRDCSTCGKKQLRSRNDRCRNPT